MKIMLRAAIAVFSVGIGSAHAGDGDGNSATTLFTSIQNKLAVPAHGVAAQAPTIAAQNGGAAPWFRRPLAESNHVVVPRVFVTGGWVRVGPILAGLDRAALAHARSALTSIAATHGPR